MVTAENPESVDGGRFPEWASFAQAVQRRRPDAGTWCAAWTVRDIVIHQTGNAEELGRVLAGHLTGALVPTRGFEEREAPYRNMNDADLWSALCQQMAQLGQQWMTDHSVQAVGRPLLRRGCTALGLRSDERIDSRLRVDGRDDVVVGATADETTISLAPPEGPATIETDAAARVLLLWGRRPADPSRIRSNAGPVALGRLRTLLSGY